MKKTTEPRTPSQAQIDANRRNALKSSGPRTPAGKDTSSRNRLVHGLRANKHILLDENPEHFSMLLDDLFDRFRPIGDGEEKLVLRIAASQWRLDRAFPIEAGLYRDRLIQIVYRDSSYKLEYVNHRKNHAARPNIVPPPPPLPAKEDLIARAFAADCVGASHLAQLARYESAIEHSLDRTIRQLKFFQETRRAAEAAEAAAAPERPHAPAEDTPPWPNAEGDWEKVIPAENTATVSNEANCHSNPIRKSVAHPGAAAHAAVPASPAPPVENTATVSIEANCHSNPIYKSVAHPGAAALVFLLAFLRAVSRFFAANSVLAHWAVTAKAWRAPSFGLRSASSFLARPGANGSLPCYRL